ncbi:MAG TPA: peptidoglycan DD-metalloendopeptidase family protein [Candidatus Paceibacterota bacterium]|nr:peptidoglycan DD-metalloendopeptidase family protein [Candidatus Paceibacterota bacterium]HMP18734.1 peptidoglycan DD-metalloendopeptidase family protein [Candidatus Paceibacterota bacterium]HMP85259.1 peptidoglycan DD-metalloendopeptidase family protein [Candidatus Paceibacterota bacterium]
MINSKINTKKINLVSVFLIICLIGFFIITNQPQNTSASTTEIDRLSKEIDQKRTELQKIDAEIAKQRQALQSVSGRANTLQNTLAQLEASRKKLLVEITKTETKIIETELLIDKIGFEIKQKESLIKQNSDALASSMRKINDLNSKSFVEKILGYESISDFWSDLEQTEILKNKINLEIIELKKIIDDLGNKEIEKQQEKNILSVFKQELASERESVESTKKQQDDLLKRTKNEEAEYQKILAENLRKRQSFERELMDIESKLNILIDPKSYPAPRNGILSWPLDSIRVTQAFGGSQFAKTNPHIYGRPFHPGTDFAAPVGTRVKSVYQGKVIGLGNTDAYPGCYAWGKWILVEHPNGLTSLYAHLSSISVVVGQEVSTGQMIGLSGNTGVTTGPHLHLTIYASQGVKVGKYGEYRPGGTGCAATGATGPFADLNAYLDPMQYLPKL